MGLFYNYLRLDQIKLSLRVQPVSLDQNLESELADP